MNVKDAAEWLRDEGLKLPADIESVLDRDDSSTGSVREDVAMGHEPLDPTDIQILRILAGEDKRLVTDAIAERLRRSPKNIGKNLSKLRRLGFLVNTPRKGYELTGKGHEFSRRRSS